MIDARWTGPDLSEHSRPLDIQRPSTHTTAFTVPLVPKDHSSPSVCLSLSLTTQTHSIVLFRFSCSRQCLHYSHSKLADDSRWHLLSDQTAQSSARTRRPWRIPARLFILTDELWWQDVQRIKCDKGNVAVKGRGELAWLFVNVSLLQIDIRCILQRPAQGTIRGQENIGGGQINQIIC